MPIAWSAATVAYSLDDKTRARQLFVEDGMTYEEVAAETGISRGNLKNWGKAGDWGAAQKEFEKEYLELTTNVHKLKLTTVKNALVSMHSQDIIAATNLLKAMPANRRGKGGVDKAALFIDWMSGFVDYLKAHDAEALRHLEPHIQGFAETMKVAA